MAVGDTLVVIPTDRSEELVEDVLHEKVGRSTSKGVPVDMELAELPQVLPEKRLEEERLP